MQPITQGWKISHLSKCTQVVVAIPYYLWLYYDKYKLDIKHRCSNVFATDSSGMCFRHLTC